MLELCDQMTRRQSGGGMIKFLMDPEPEGRAYAEMRCGAEARSVIATIAHAARTGEQSKYRPFRVKLRLLREQILKRLLGVDYSAFQNGRFAASGELHKWMYDSFSLSILLKEVGFSSIVVRNAIESYMDGWINSKLDADLCGYPHKPDSLFLEAKKLLEWDE